MADTPTPFCKPKFGILPPDLIFEGQAERVAEVARLLAAARRWYELRPRYAERLRGAEVCAAWADFEAAVLDLYPEARFDFGDVPEG